MTATKKEVSDWFDEGIKEGAIAMIVGCDTFSWENYPVYCNSVEELKSKLEEMHRTEMGTIDEIYDLKKDKKEQLQMYRCFDGLELLSDY